jgi:hypothetical protein
MNSQYGNHIGVIINSLDPEGRGRVQVLIPHLSTTLLEQWNVKATDIKLDAQTFQEYLNQDHPVGKSLRENLPWAEAARPLLGSGGTTVVGLNGKIETASTPTQQPDTQRRSSYNASVEDNPKSSTSSDPNNKSNTIPWYLTQDENGNPAFKECKYGGKDRVTPDDVRAVATDYAEKNWDSIKEALGTNRPGPTFVDPVDYVDRFIIPMVTFESDFAVNTMSTDNGTNKSVGLLQTSVSDYKTRFNNPTDAALFDRYDISPDKVATDEKLKIPLTNLLGGMALIEMGLRNSPKFSVTQAMAGKVDKPDAQHPWLFGKNTITRLETYYEHGGFLPDDKKTLEDINAAGGTLGFNTSNTRQKAAAMVQPSRSPIPSTAIDYSASHTSKGPDVRLPQGSNSVPQPGNMVWVFFLNGDLQKPVYFASVTEAYANARDLPAPVAPPASAVKGLAPSTATKPSSPVGGGELLLPVSGGSLPPTVPKTTKGLTISDPPTTDESSLPQNPQDPQDGFSLLPDLSNYKPVTKPKIK